MSKEKDQIMKDIIKAIGFDEKKVKGMLIIAQDDEKVMYSIYGSIMSVTEALVVSAHEDKEGDIADVIQTYNQFNEYIKNKDSKESTVFTSGIIGEA